MGYKNVIVAFHSCFNRLKAGGFRVMHAGMQLACIVMSLHFGSPFLFSEQEQDFEALKYIIDTIFIRKFFHMTNNKQISCKIKPKHGYSILLTLF